MGDFVTTSMDYGDHYISGMPKYGYEQRWLDDEYHQRPDSYFGRQPSPDSLHRYKQQRHADDRMVDTLLGIDNLHLGETYNPASGNEFFRTADSYFDDESSQSYYGYRRPSSAGLRPVTPSEDMYRGFETHNGDMLDGRYMRSTGPRDYLASRRPLTAAHRPSTPGEVMYDRYDPRHRDYLASRRPMTAGRRPSTPSAAMYSRHGFNDDDLGDSYRYMPRTPVHDDGYPRRAVSYLDDRRPLTAVRRPSPPGDVLYGGRGFGVGDRLAESYQYMPRRPVYDGLHRRVDSYLDRRPKGILK